MPTRALLRPLAAGALIVASAGALAANATTRQASVAFDSPAPPAWTQAAETPGPNAHPLLAQVFFVDARGDQAARIRAQMERMEARARADDRLNGRVQPREGGGRGDWQQQEQPMRQERGNPPGGYGNWHGNRRG
ncbi:hypothetical protein [Ralstonia solanacearum]|nr:hypothetical protein [Ralstonia solanacearum]AMP70833.1 hypothetical protein UW163_15900 [Ralstonia solanacearum]AMP75186.1 hypothetical protein RALBFv3_13880 [Ralstonia solanacearum]AYB61199.1 hypothetical protein C2124_11805 [Ralstonia solanacearum]KFX30473.1 signal peptide protein [Ralstonia solanacearum]MBB6582792.1 hypothetical protein [Ralstonia solanacearum]